MNRPILSRALALAPSLWMAGPALAAPPGPSVIAPPPQIGTTPGTVAAGNKACDITGATDCSGAVVTATGGTAARTMAARAADAFNVLDNGLVGDGVTDDTPKLQVLLNRASAAVTSPGRARIDFPQPSAACYALKSSVAIPSNIDLNPLGRVTLCATGTTGAILTATNVSNFVVGPFTLDQRGGTLHTTIAQAVNVSGSSDFLIDRVKLVNPVGSIVVQGGSSLFRIVRPDVQRGIYHGVQITDSFDGEVLDGYFRGNVGFGVILTGTTHRVLVQGNTTPGNGIELIGTTKTTYQNRIIGNHAEDTGDNCISITGHENVVEGNVAIGCAGNGIDSYGDRNTVVGNVAKNNAQQLSSWTSGASIIPGQVVQSNGGRFVAQNYGTTGSTAPSGADRTNPVSDGGVSWLYTGGAINSGWSSGILIQGGFGGTGQHNVAIGNTVDDDQAIHTQTYGVQIGVGIYSAWTSNASYVAGAYVYSGLNLYQNNGTAGTAGSTAPTGTTTASDGAITWTYVSIFDTDVLNDWNQVYGNQVKYGGTVDNSGASNNLSAPYTLPSNVPGASFFSTGGIGSIAKPVSTTYSFSAAALAGALPTVIVVAPVSGTRATAHLTTLFLYGFGTPTGGAGCSVNDVLTIQGGTPVTSATNLASGAARTIKVTAVDGNGAVTGLTAGTAGTYFYSLPWADGATLTGGTCTTAPKLNGSVWQLAAAPTVDSAGTGYSGNTTASYNPTAGGVTSVATSSAQTQLVAGAGTALMDGNGAHLQYGGTDAFAATSVGALLGSAGTSGKPAIAQGALIDASGVRTALTTSGYTVPANTSLVRFTQTGAVTATITLPTALADGQPIQFDNQGTSGTSGAITATFSPAVQGFANGGTIAANSGFRIRWDATAAAWQREQ